MNAVPTVCAERALAQAQGERGSATAGGPRGWLAGLPVLIKDLNDVAGVRTTYGSPIFADHVPERSGCEVERLEAHGAIVLGKTNTPEFGAGAQHLQRGLRRDPQPVGHGLTCGGSSGGSAVALATGMAWLADGSDLGGSLRTPASFCSVVGLRPIAGPGRRTGPRPRRSRHLAVEGPMARDVRDAALMLDAQAGLDPRDPSSFEAPAAPSRPRSSARCCRGGSPSRPTSAGSRRSTPRWRRSAGRDAALRRARCRGRRGLPGPLGRHRGRSPSCAPSRSWPGRGPLLERHRDRLKPEVVWNIERGPRRDGRRDRPRRARARRHAARAMAEFLGSTTCCCCPAAIVPPFPVAQRYVEELNGHRFPSYIDWVACCYAITLTGCPALCLPCGFTASGLPVGLQIVGPPARRGAAPGAGGDARGRAGPGGAGAGGAGPLGQPSSRFSTAARRCSAAVSMTRRRVSSGRRFPNSSCARSHRMSASSR